MRQVTDYAEFLPGAVSCIGDVTPTSRAKLFFNEDKRPLHYACESGDDSTLEYLRYLPSRMVQREASTFDSAQEEADFQLRYNSGEKSADEMEEAAKALGATMEQYEAMREEVRAGQRAELEAAQQQVAATRAELEAAKARVAHLAAGMAARRGRRARSASKRAPVGPHALSP